VVGIYALICLGGGLLLATPQASAGPDAVPVNDAVFTAVSAVSTTGLAVVDTTSAWSDFGLVVLLVLMQLGGLGIMTVAALLALAIGRRLGDSHEAVLAESPTIQRGDVRQSLVAVIALSAVIELVATLVLAAGLVADGQPLGAALWRGLFSAVSAFNNVGLSLWGGAVVDAPGGLWTALWLSAAIFAGGLGPRVFRDLRRRLRGGRRLSLHSRVTLWTTGALLVAGTAFITLAEWGNPATLGAQPSGQRPVDALTYSVSTRSAGFEMVPTPGMHSESLLWTDIMMFIGGGSGSTAGGIKVTTFFILALAAWSELRGRTSLATSGRELPAQLARQALAVAAAASLVIVAGTMAILASGPWSLEQALFEATSAFTTSGLSTGITPDLSGAGQAVVMALMFFGRIGPLTLAAALALRERPPLYRYPTERVIVG
jgi:trk system potassium uptake protein